MAAVVESEGDELGLADGAVLTGSAGEESHATNAHEATSKSTVRRDPDANLQLAGPCCHVGSRADEHPDSGRMPSSPCHD